MLLTKKIYLLILTLKVYYHPHIDLKVIIQRCHKWIKKIITQI